MSRYYDRQGQPISGTEWTLDGNHVAHTKLDEAEVSTIYLGLDHCYGDGPPLIFETLIFGGVHDGEMWRYSTEAEACEGHEHAVVVARAAENMRGIDAGVLAAKGVQ